MWFATALSSSKSPRSSYIDIAHTSLPPVLHNRAIARGTYDRIEAEVETGVREYEAAEKKKAENQPKRDTKVKFADDSAAQ